MANVKTKVLILGAGPAGIGAAIRLGDACVVVERKRVGGQSGSLNIGQAVFDIGGHSFHTPHNFIRDLVYNTIEMYDQKRDARCYTHGTLLPYPFQKNFREIKDVQVVRECAEGLEKVNGKSVNGTANFKEFISARFGKGIARHFMIPYNEKLWARDLTLLDTDWVGERVAAPEGVEEEFEVTGGKRKPLQSDTTVGYPARGGFGEIYKALAKKINELRFGVEIKHIAMKHRRAYSSNGDCYEYESLVSTLPLNELFLMLDEYPENLTQPLARLQYMSLKCAMVAIGHPVDTDIQRVYCADPSVPSHKIAVNHNSSDWLRSRPEHGIMGEISYSPFKKFTREDLLEWFIDGLIRIGLLKDRNEVFGSKLVDIKYAYPVPTHDRREIVDTLKRFLCEQSIHTVGRFGEWTYINSDEALARGVALVEQLGN